MSLVGLRVGPFEITGRAALRGHGDWFFATRAAASTRTPGEVLIKLVGSDASPEAKAALQREFEVLRDLGPPRVPVGVAFYEGAGAMAVEPFEGTSLAQLVERPATERDALGPATWLDVAVDLAETLHRAHQQGLAHGRLDPSRVLVGARGALTLLDFGTVAPVDPVWASPEHAAGGPITPATDQWSLGALLAGVLTGRPPSEHRRDTDDWLAQVAAGQPDLGRALRQMLAPAPADRFPHLQAARKALLAIGRRSGGHAERHELGTWAARFRRGPGLPAEQLAVVHPDVQGDVPLADRGDEEAIDDEATVLYDAADLRRALAHGAAEGDLETTQVFGPDLTGELEPVDDQDTDMNKRIAEAVLADDDEDSLAQTLDRADVPVDAILVEPEPTGGPPPLDLPVETTADQPVDLAYDEEDSGPYHAPVDLSQIDTAPNEAWTGPHGIGPHPARPMSTPEKVASGLLATLAGLMLLWFLVQVLG